MKTIPKLLLVLFIILQSSHAIANTYIVNPSTYAAKLPTLIPGDTMLLDAGIYPNSLNIYNINGTPLAPILIMGKGDSTAFVGNACCNTVSIKTASYIILRDVLLNGNNVAGIDAVKAEGTAGNWTHHITLENLYIANYNQSQQQVGISTKCPSSNWIIRKIEIYNVGTGMYLGNSDGTKPFVNGIIENNLITNTIGYNIEIKRQINGQRDTLEGITAQCNVAGKTIIRHNVFSKSLGSGSGANARPNLLVGGMPTIGSGVNDYYEIYSNLFYNNPTEALFQGCGHVYLYNNIFVNNYDPAGYRTVIITPQDGLSVKSVSIFHNTLWSKSTTGGIRIFNPDTTYTQRIEGNAVFQQVSNGITSNQAKVVIADNTIDEYNNAATYVISTNFNITQTDLYPKIGQLKGTLISKTPFIALTDYDRDFNRDSFDWTYRGAYSGSGVNNGWKLDLDFKTFKPLNKDTLPEISLDTNAVTIHEGNSIVIPITIQHVNGKPITIKYSLSGTAIRDTDYTISPLDSMTFPANAINGTKLNLTIQTKKDNIMTEDIETIFIQIASNQANYQSTLSKKKINITPIVWDENKIQNQQIHFSLYPNPTSESIHLCTDDIPANTPWKIVDALGKTRLNGILNNKETMISAEDLERGVYYLEVGGERFQMLRE